MNQGYPEWEEARRKTPEKNSRKHREARGHLGARKEGAAGARFLTLNTHLEGSK